LDSHNIEVWELVVSLDDDLRAGQNIRQCYCIDEEIDILRDGTGLSRKDYLEQLVFPDKKIYALVPAFVQEILQSY
jgi:hypothetical protein